MVELDVPKSMPQTVFMEAFASIETERTPQVHDAPLYRNKRCCHITGKVCR
jgi:hypothetical protein